MIRLVVMKNSIACVTMVVTICFVLVLLLTMLKLPEVSTRKRGIGSDLIIFKTRKVPNDDRLGKFGEMMIEMLPRDLAFTVFVPSEKAFSRDLGLRVNDSLNDTYAMVSRILGFSAVPRPLSSVNVPFGEQQLSYDSLSGFTLFISKDIDGRLVVNRIKSEIVDLRKKEIVIHIMDGVIMDADFEQSILPED
ncbi:Fasciclin domain-containing protein [Quillaja saponaria]|uniref:Fasciclin domain-containing protein n=1 Tax=Quillaja saponaria TaxID=32244 RepID=A0AAD7LTP0_QUISA|nr:Fasciclin domain-containing protein [Quillaja saponaria]KAJ7964023.1 Fasciclin domain-containing protein [Quillaja saponaria]